MNDKVIEFPKDRTGLRGSPGAGGASAPPVASEPDWLQPLLDRLFAKPQDERADFDSSGVIACGDFLTSGVEHMVDAFGLDRALVRRWFTVAAAHELLKAAGGQSAMASLLKLAAVCQGRSENDGPEAA